MLLSVGNTTERVREDSVKKIKITTIITASLICIIFFLFIKTGMQIHWTARLVEAIQSENEQDVKKILNEKFLGVPYDVNNKEFQIFPLSLFKELEKELPLVCACETENFDIVCMLVESGADVNKTLEGHFSPLETALLSFNYASCWEETYQVVELLVQHGADIEQITFDNYSMYELCAGMLPYDGEVYSEEMEKQILEIYILLNDNGKNGEKYRSLSLEQAQQADNEMLADYLLKVKIR